MIISFVGRKPSTDHIAVLIDVVPFLVSGDRLGVFVCQRHPSRDRYVLAAEPRLDSVPPHAQVALVRSTHDAYHVLSAGGDTHDSDPTQERGLSAAMA